MEDFNGYEKSCGAVIYKSDNDKKEFLIIKNINNYWGYPKGHIENSEREEETALREVYEETGLKIKLIDGFRIETEYLISAALLKKVVYFAGKSDNDTVNIQIEEVEDYRWLNYEEALKQLTYDSDKNILKAVEKFLRSNGK